MATKLLNLQKGNFTNDKPLGGKTGSCGGVGWFVRFIEKDGNTKVFAFNIKGFGANGVEAKKIALEFLKEAK